MKREISVAIVAADKRKVLPYLLRTLMLNQNRKYIREIIINNLNNDNPRLKSIITNLSNKYNIEFKIVHVCGWSDPLEACRRRLARIASGKIVSFLDDDVIVSPKWGYEVHKAFHKYRCDVVAGILLPPRPYKNIVKKSFSRYIARGLTVYNTWFLCRCGLRIKSDDIIVIEPPSYCYTSCSSGLWGANLSIKRQLYLNMKNDEFLGYMSGKPIGGDDNKTIIWAFRKKMRVCLSLNAVAYHFTEPYKASRLYIFKKYSYFSKIYNNFLKTAFDKDLYSINYGYVREAINTVLQELANDFSIKPISVLDTLTIMILILLKKVFKNDSK
ncbi:hypothetical protein PYJP_17070 [Pyrofollis japonicus]|uniref:glycosyltransferase n=1 Tax=Pyrofollis japonicus TaxID=3060460 RepID=UPI00295AA59A|nr:glycosyltransferase [Pyrofollis japonicus]BEP18355.1 hypothetical protein PYJP_17070 [Pyrofollis japonicus]